MKCNWEERQEALGKITAKLISNENSNAANNEKQTWAEPTTNVQSDDHDTKDPRNQREQTAPKSSWQDYGAAIRLHKLRAVWATDTQPKLWRRDAETKVIASLINKQKQDINER